MMDLPLLLGRDLAPQPGEATPRSKAVAQLVAVEIGHHRGQELDCLIDVDRAHSLRLGEQRRCLDVGCENLAIAIEDVGSGGCNGVLWAYASPGGTLRRDRDQDQADRNDSIDKRKRSRREAKPSLRLLFAIDMLAVE